MLKLMLCALLISFCLAEGSNSSFRFNSTQTSFAKFKGLTLTRPGIAQLQFCFKTVSPSVILLYQGDGSDKYIFLELRKGKIDLNVRGHTYCKTIKTTKAEQTVLNDSRWHRVHIEIDTRKSTRITLQVDSYLAATVERSRERDEACRDLKLPSEKNGKELYLYLAGSEVLHEPAFGSIIYLAVDPSYRFIGCIANFEYTTSDAPELQPAEVVEVIGFTGDCNDACANNDMKKCDHGNQCSMEPHAKTTDNATNTNNTEPSTEDPHSFPDSNTEDNNDPDPPIDKWDRERTHSVAPASLAPFCLRADIVVTLLHVFFATWLSSSRTRLY